MNLGAVFSSTCNALDHSESNHTLLRVHDFQNQLLFLVDCGAMLSILPKTLFVPEIQSSGTLRAANGSEIEIVGKKELLLDISLGRTFVHTFLVGDVHEPIIGADFLGFNRILVSMSRGALLLESTLSFFNHNKEDIKPDYLLELEPDTTDSEAKRDNVVFGYDISSLDSDLQRIIHKYPRVLDVTVFKDPPKHDFRMKIELDTKKPIFSKPRTLPAALELHAMKIVDELQSLGVMKSGSSEYNTNSFVITKSDNSITNPSYRLINDFRPLNAHMLPSHFPLPYVSSLYPRVEGKTIFSRIDFKSAFYSLPLDPDSVKYTTVSVGHRGTFQFLKAPLGLKTSANCFQEFVSTVFRGCDSFFFIFIDDGILFSSSREEHLVHLEIIFKRVFDYGLVLNLKKCDFFVTDLVFLGVRLTVKGILPLTKRVQAIKDISLPLRQKALRSWCGIVAFNRKWLPKAAEIMGPIYDLLEKRGNKPIKWNDKAKEAFETIKLALCDETLLVHPIKGADLQLYSDASNYACGATLRQVFNGECTTIGYFSKRFTPVQQKYSTFTLELLGAKLAITHFAFYLKGRAFTLFLDCKAIVMAVKKKAFENLSNMDFRLIRSIIENTSDVRHISGEINEIPDALSRPEINSMTENISQVIKSFSYEDIADKQTDDFIRRIKSMKNSSLKIEQRVLPDSGKVIFGDASVFSKFRPIVPDCLRFRVFQLYHSLYYYFKS